MALFDYEKIYELRAKLVFELTLALRDTAAEEGTKAARHIAKAMELATELAGETSLDAAMRGQREQADGCR